MKSVKILVILVFSFIIFQFSTCDKENINPKPLKLSQYTFDSTPNASDNVGYIFAIDKNHVAQPIINLNIKYVDNPIVLPSSSSSTDVSYGGLLSFLGLTNLDLNVSDSLKNNRKLTVKINFDNPILSRGYLVQVDSALGQRNLEIYNTIKKQDLLQSTLYLIIETIKTKKLTYDFSKSNIGNDTLKANFQKIASLKANSSWNNNNLFSLSYSLPTQLTVFYKLKQIDVLPGLGGTPIYKKGADVVVNELISLKK